MSDRKFLHNHDEYNHEKYIENEKVLYRKKYMNFELKLLYGIKILSFFSCGSFYFGRIVIMCLL